MDPILRNKNFDQCCRTCLNDVSSKFYELFADYQNSTTLAEMLLICTSIAVEKEDRLPKKLCGGCYNCLVSFYDFRIQAEKVEDVLKLSQDEIGQSETLIPGEKQIQIKIEIDHPIENQDYYDNFETDFNDSDEATAAKCEDTSESNDQDYCTVLQVKAETCYETQESVENSSYKCKVCDKIFKTLSMLQKHESKHNEEEYSCNFCSETFIDESQLVRHLVQHSEKKESMILGVNQNEISQTLECGICSASFKSVHSLSAHMRVHVEKGRVLSCRLCDKVFKKLSHLKRHELSHEVKHLYKCSICHKSFYTESLLNEHTNKHHGIKSDGHLVKCEKKDEPMLLEVIQNDIGRSLECGICSISFKSANSLSAHMKVHVEKGRVLSCRLCDKIFKKFCHLKRHELSHKVNRPHKCSICPKSFFSESRLNEHTILHHGIRSDGLLVQHSEKTEEPMLLEVNQNEISQILECGICSVSFKSAHSLSAHMRVHVEKGRVLSCILCDKVFKKLSHLKRHELSHEVNRPYKCSTCPKSFYTESLLNEHSNRHHGIKPHHCPFCTKSFSNVSGFTTHLKIHTRGKIYLCSTCGKKFDSSTNLNQHMKRHLGIKTFACNLCPRSFISKGELKSHFITHTGEKSYTCDQCGAAFTKRSSLVKHNQRHLGIKPHQCETCSRKFTSKSHLKRHYRIHTGEKPYRCEICERAFTQSNDLVKHRRAHLGDKLYRCTHCTESFRLKNELRHHISEHFISSRLQGIDMNSSQNCPNNNTDKEDAQKLSKTTDIEKDGGIINMDVEKEAASAVSEVTQ